MASLRNRLLAPIFGYFGRLRFPTLVTIAVALFVADVLIPDGLPFADEILLGLLSALLVSWKKRREESPTPDEPARR